MIEAYDKTFGFVTKKKPRSKFDQGFYLARRFTFILQNQLLLYQPLLNQQVE